LDTRVIDSFGVAEDPQMPSLRGALDPRQVVPLFDAHVAGLHEALGPWRLRTVRVARYKPERRCLIEYHFEARRSGGAAGTTVLLGKVCRRGLRKSSYGVQAALYEGGFHAGAADGICVPEPLGTLPELEMWLQRKVPGVPATRLLAAPAGAALAQRIAEALYKLHRTAVPATRRHTMADELGILGERLALVAQARPHWAGRVRQILDACRQLGAATVPAATCGVHRDFYPDQVIVEGRRLYLLDFDLYCEGDPALDAGNFRGHLVEYALRVLGDAEALRDCEQAFAQRFAELSGESPSGSAAAYTLLTLVRHIHLSMQFEQRTPFTEALLELCEQRLGLAAKTGAV
jgi:hypothetical protein